MRYRRRPYEVEARKLANGNYVIEFADGRRESWMGEAFEVAFEAVDVHVCRHCGAETFFDNGAQRRLCPAGCRAD